MTAFPYLERRMAAALGVGRAWFRRQRGKMERGAAWEETPGGIGFSTAGFYAVLAALGLDGQDAAALQKKCAAAAPENGHAAVTGQVERFFLNRLLLGVRLEGGRMVQVRVPRGRELFQKKMRVEVRPVAGAAYYELATHLPRRKGRW